MTKEIPDKSKSSTKLNTRENSANNYNSRKSLTPLDAPKGREVS